MDSPKSIDKEQVRQIAERLRGLREAMDLTAEEVAEVCRITKQHYEEIENGDRDPSLYNLKRISSRYGIQLDALLYGEEPLMNTYFLTRKGRGKEAIRRKSYKYHSLASGFRGRKVDPFVVEIDPKPNNGRFRKNSHDGQEFDLVIEGELELSIGEKTLSLYEGDCIYFDATQPHCMRAIGGKPVKFLCVVI